MLDGFDEKEARRNLELWCARADTNASHIVEARRMFEVWVVVCRLLGHAPAAIRMIDDGTLQQAIFAFYMLPDNVVNRSIALDLRAERHRRKMNEYNQTVYQDN